MFDMGFDFLSCFNSALDWKLVNLNEVSMRLEGVRGETIC